MFQPVESSVSFPKLEEEISRYWKGREIYEKSLAARKGGPGFVFYEGPPTANGLPHPGHCLTRAIKDLFPRYKTMRGYLCRRKAGWDTHGLPVEVEVCKELGIHSKEEIEAFGVEPFIRKCVESVFRYTQQWEQLTERLGFWIHLDDAYVTFHQSYVESVWWALKSLFDRGLLYQGHKIVWWWAQGGTALSSGEVGQGYREVADPSVYVRFPLVEERGEGRGERGEGGPPIAGSRQGSPLLSGEGQKGSPLPLGEGHGEGLFHNADLLVWTTTPWTLPSNQFAAVKPDLEYAVVLVEGEKRKLIVAASLVDAIASKLGKEFDVVGIRMGHQLLGLRYRPPFNYFYSKFGEERREWYRPTNDEPWADYPWLYVTGYVLPDAVNSDPEDKTRIVREWFAQNPTRPISWHIVPGDFVTTDAGTGIVHIAPAFGEVDLDVLKREQQLFGPNEDVPPLLCPVAPNGKFTDEVPDYAGRWVKDCDRDIIRQMKAEGTLFHQEQYVHDYPFCWRAEEDPLIQYPRKSWFIRTTAFKEKMLANNSRINWLPEHIRDGRFGNFLETNVDWALSRERYWGTPLPIWVCEKTGYAEAVGSYTELLAKPGVAGTEAWENAKKESPALPDDLCVHKPYIDAVTYDSPKAKGARMRRVSEVIDCWFDSGAMPFAQWGYPNRPGSAEQFRDQFPADFISEALDQTRGWFYSLLAISTLLFSEEGSGFRVQRRDEGPATRGKEQGTEEQLREIRTFAETTLAEVREKLSDINLRLEMRTSKDTTDDSGQSSRNENLKSPNPEIPKSLPSNPQSLIPNPSPFPHPFRNCIVLGLMLGEDGGKMSKSKRNYREPNEIFDRYGADALRWYFFANQPPWTSIRYSEQAIKECIPEFLLRLWNVYSFFVIYANIDGFDPAAALGGAGVPPAPEKGTGPICRNGPEGASHKWGLSPFPGPPAQLGPGVLAQAKGYRPVADRGELDRWILSELNRTAVAVVERMDAYDNFAACARLTEFVDALSNWYVRRSRDRFWSSEKIADSADKSDAYWTLYECLLTTCKLIAPFVPFLAEAMWRNLAAAEFGGASCGAGVPPAHAAGTAAPQTRAAGTAALQTVAESVHLCDYPVGDPAAVDRELSERMALMREIVSLGRSARMGAKLKVRQPLKQVEVVLADKTHQPWLEEHDALICDELNVKRVEFTEKAEQYITYSVLPDLKRLGPRLGKRLPALRKLLAEADAAKLLAELEAEGKVTLPLPDGFATLDSADIQVRLQAKEGWAAAQGHDVVVVLSTELTEDLIREGLARELVRTIQDRRKEMGCEFTDRIAVGIVTESAELRSAIEQFADYIRGETLAIEIAFGPLADVEGVDIDVAGHSAMLYIRVDRAAR